MTTLLLLSYIMVVIKFHKIFDFPHEKCCIYVLIKWCLTKKITNEVFDQIKDVKRFLICSFWK